MKNTKNDNEQKLQQNLPEQVFIVAEQMVNNVYHVHMDEEIIDNSYYRNLITLLNNATPEDVIVFHISSVGGMVDSAVSICNAIRTTEAQTIAVIQSYACSAASLFIMTTDSVIAMPHSYVMIHPAMYGYGEDMKKLRKFVEFHDKRLMEVFHDFYEGFLSEDEIENMVENSMELWLTADEVIDRLNDRDGDQEAVLADGEEDIDDLIEEVLQEAPKRRKGVKKND